MLLQSVCSRESRGRLQGIETLGERQRERKAIVATTITTTSNYHDHHSTTTTTSTINLPGVLPQSRRQINTLGARQISHFSPSMPANVTTTNSSNRSQVVIIIINNVSTAAAVGVFHFH